MKSIITVLALSTLSVAASAQTADAPAGLAYNRVGLAYSDSTRGFGLEASALIGNTNLLIEASTTIGGGSAGNGADSVSLGYVFKNLAYGADVIATVGSDETYGLTLRKALPANFEVTVGYERTAGVNLWGAELAYNFNRQVSFAVAYVHASNAPANVKSNDTQLFVRYSF
jgi:hypothetical protein